jgi:parallel beta-helix repeat protein
MKRKWLAIGIILLFLGTCIIPATAQNTEKSIPTSRGNWLYVGGSGPGNYTHIQDAIDNASDGDTVFVYDDSSPYCEEVIINNSITLLGENQETVIKGTNKTTGVAVHAMNVKIQTFSIVDARDGIDLETGKCDNCMIVNVIFFNNTYGLFLCSDNSIIIDNTFLNNYMGMWIEGSNNEITKNIFEGQYYGVFFHYCVNSSFHRNYLWGNHIGLYFRFRNEKRDIVISQNTFINNSCAIHIYENFKNNIIKENNFITNEDDLIYRVIFLQRFKVDGNFWGENGSRIKIIPGISLFELGYNPIALEWVYLKIPWFIVDWHPAQEPYDISGMS